MNDTKKNYSILLEAIKTNNISAEDLLDAFTNWHGLQLLDDDYANIVIIDSSNRERMCRYPEYFTKQGKYIWENGLEGQVEDIMEKIPCSREMAIEYVYLMNKVFK